MSILVLHKSNASRRGHLARAAEYAKKNGDRLLLVVKDPTWEKQFADVVVSVDTSDVEATVAAVRELAASEPEPIRAVAAFVGHSVPAAAAVASDLGLPFVSEHVARTVRDKYAMREAFGSENVPQPAYGLARTVDEAVTQAARIGFPLVLKPLIDNDSGYFRRVDDVSELTEHFAVIQRGAWSGIAHNPLYAWMVEKYDSAILLEEYLPGAEVSVESIVVDGQAHVVAIHDKPLPMEGPYFVDVHYATPSRLPVEVRDRIVELTAASHRAVGIESGAVHTEFRIQSDGTPKILETAARLGGGPIYQSVLLSTGVDMVAAVLDVASGRKPDLRPKPEPTPAGFYLFFAEKAGRISGISGVEEAGLKPHVHELSLYRKVGDAVDVPPRVWQSHGHVIFTADSDDGLVETFDELVKSIKIEIE
ncbi:ATP-grasp domain-containing protein [Streptomyces sp. APSN-46.1]|uniref:ATP-grasp domain-containing protein n=1 Tax=Streptomyces sp. APSN-46.1 TaxID=2929049 RepID=UPI001FB56CB9|nr:ATP-grasp domain-containing protein [Streptomyces sp. APSN-46.1]MCJ1677455.1 ATP-grasp domain-containing protein [Streptomyces sp. APSN-46.1]